MPGISPTSSSLKVSLPPNVENEREKHGTHHSVNNYLVAINSSSDIETRHLKKTSASVSHRLLSWLKAWCSSPARQGTAENNDVGVIGHSLLLQADAISAQHHEGGGTVLTAILKVEGKSRMAHGGRFVGGGDSRYIHVAPLCSASVQRKN